MLRAKDFTERRNRICKGPIEEGSMNEHSEQEILRKSVWHEHNYSRVDGMRVRVSG